MHFVGLALISALAAPGTTWGCQNAQPPSPGMSEAASVPASRTENLAPKAEAAPVALAAAGSAAEAAPRVTRSVLPSSDPHLLLAAGDPPLTGDRPGEERLLQDPLIGDTLIGDGEPMDDVDDAASGVAAPPPGTDPSPAAAAAPGDVAKPDPDQAGAPVEPPFFPGPAPRPSAGSTDPGQAEPRGTALENQQR